MKNIIIKLLSNALLNKSISIKDDIEWDKLYLFARKQQVSVLLYYGLLNTEIFVPQEILKKFESDVFLYTAISCNQDFETGRIAESFEKNGIDYMLLKGTVLKDLYPKPEMRQMCDADILIRTEQAEKAATIMSQLGFEYKYESDHELAWSKGGKISVELHKRLIPSYNKDFYAYYGDGWNRAVKSESKKFGYELGPEDNYIYVFTHFAKHYRDAGIGVRHILDIYLLQSHIEDLEYVEKELKKLQLFEFHCNVLNTLKVWFEGAEATLQTDIITDRIFSGGAYGTSEAHILSSAVKSKKTTGSTKGSICNKIIQMIFPPMPTMQSKYSVLKKCPFLLPVVWVWRWITALMFRHNNIKAQARVAKTLKEEKVDEYQMELNFVGLDFNFKE